MTFHRWFVVAQFGGYIADLRSTVRPGSLTHAKEMGTRVTACGLNCDTWVKLWGQSFPMLLERSCPECLVLVGSDSRERAGDSDLLGLLLSQASAEAQGAPLQNTEEVTMRKRAHRSAARHKAVHVHVPDAGHSR